MYYHLSSKAAKQLFNHIAAESGIEQKFMHVEGQSAYFDCKNRADTAVKFLEASGFVQKGTHYVHASGLTIAGWGKTLTVVRAKEVAFSQFNWAGLLPGVVLEEGAHCDAVYRGDMRDLADVLRSRHILMHRAGRCLMGGEFRAADGPYTIEIIQNGDEVAIHITTPFLNWN